MTEVNTVAEAEPYRERIEGLAVDWLGAPGGRDWDSFLSRVERTLDIELPIQYDAPVLKRVTRWATKAWREANQ